ncbi:MAG TPA: hypothetical protein VJJ28_01580 [Candidatus Paceibacterota bacterium]
MHTNRKHYILLLMAIVTSLFSIAGYFFLYRAIALQAEKSSQTLQDTVRVDEAKQYQKNLLDTYEKSLTDRSRIDDFVISQEEIVSFIENVESIGTFTNTELTLSSIDTDDFTSTSESVNGYLKARIELRGSWTNVMRAIILFENMPFGVSFNNMRLSKMSAGLLSSDKKQFSKVGMWGMSLDIKVLTSK